MTFTESNNDRQFELVVIIRIGVSKLERVRDVLCNMLQAFDISTFGGQW